MKKNKVILGIILILLLLVVYSYIICVQSIPDNIVIFQGESVNLKTVLGMKLNLSEKGEIVETL